MDRQQDWCLCAAGVVRHVGFNLVEEREGNATLEGRRGFWGHLQITKTDQVQ